MKAKKAIAIVGGAVVLLIIIIIAIANSVGKSSDKELPESNSEITESTSSSSSSESAENSSSSSESTSISFDFVDVPPENTETGTTDTNEGGYGSCLPLYCGRGVYANYKFKPTARKLSVSLELYADENWDENRKLTVTLYKRSGSSWISAGQKTFRFVPDPSDQYKIFDFSHTFTGLDNSTEYCVRLYNDSTSHSGYADRDYAIGADLIISAS